MDKKMMELRDKVTEEWTVNVSYSRHPEQNRKNSRITDLTEEGFTQQIDDPSLRELLPDGLPFKWDAWKDAEASGNTVHVYDTTADGERLPGDFITYEFIPPKV